MTWFIDGLNFISAFSSVDKIFQAKHYIALETLIFKIQLKILSN
jgi:hypothetical protein